jgi:hypothetical protein
MARRRLGELLVDIGLIDDFQLRSALSDQKRWGRPLGATLVKLGFVAEDELVRVLSRHLDVPIVDLHGKRIAPEALALLPVEVAEKSRCVPLFKKREGGAEALYLGMEDPTDLAVVDELSFRTGLKIHPVLVGPSQLADAIERHYHKLEWEEEQERAAAGFELPVEPGDTAPLVFRPPAPDVRTPKLVGPEQLERGPSPHASERAGGVAPLGERELVLETAVDPPPAAPVAARAASAPAAQTAAPRDLGPEFIVERPTAVPPSPATAARAPAAAPPPEAKPRDVPTRVILRALTQLLIEKGVIARGELMDRVRALDRSGDDDEPPHGGG